MVSFIVAIDGTAGSGKSTTARGVAQNLRFFYLDTGAMYRAFTLKYLRENSSDKIDEKLIERLLSNTEITIIPSAKKNKVLLDGMDVTTEIRTPEVSKVVSQISAIGVVREWMVKRQRALAADKNVVCEGRDIGTVVFPDAQVKVFMDANISERAKRRQQEGQEKGIKTDLNEIIENLKFRDKYDSSRDHSPLKKDNQAIFLDTTDLSIAEEIEIIEKIVRRRFKNQK